MTERDQAIERLLRTRLGDDGVGVREDCLDAETMAAWVDGGLLPAQRALAERHVADCARCQETIALMVRSTPEVVAAAPAWSVTDALRWLIPLTGVAAAAVAWFMVPGPRIDTIAPAAPAATTVQVTPSPAPEAAAPVSSDTKEKAAPARPVEAAKTAARSELGADSRARANTGEAERRADVMADATANARAASALPDRPSAPPAPPRVSGAAETVMPPPAPAGPPPPRALTEQSAAAPSAAPFAAAAGRSGGIGGAAGRGVAVLQIVSSDPAVRWRGTAAAVVEYSADGGQTWQRQSTGVAGTIAAGSAPSRAVCWLVGADGLVMVTTDAQRWTRIAFPDPVALAAVVATDEEHATVTTIDGRRFVTADGGATWTQAPAQDFPAAPF